MYFFVSLKLLNQHIESDQELDLMVLVDPFQSGNSIISDIGQQPQNQTTICEAGLWQGLSIALLHELPSSLVRCPNRQDWSKE